MFNDICPICNSMTTNYDEYDDFYYIDCTSCGDFAISTSVDIEEDANKIIASMLINEIDQSYNLRPSSSNYHCKTLIKYHFKTIRDRYFSIAPQTAIEMLANFLSYYCGSLRVGKMHIEHNVEIAAAIKSLDVESAKWVLKQANEIGWLSKFEFLSEGIVGFEISALGWRQYYENQKDYSKQKTAFFALAFKNKILRRKITPYLKSACKRAGYELLAVNDSREAGSIDDKIRVDIRNSRFLVVDISDQNQGAYFEAGFAEGLGKPVFYICDKDVFDKHHNRKGGKKTIHFDIEHHDIISWDKSVPSSIEGELLASIRNTLPNEANMIDE